MRNPPILVSVIGFFSMLAGINEIVLGLRILGFDWFGLLGDLPKLEQAGLWGWIALAAGAFWFAVAVGLWMLQPWAWLTAIVVAGFSLFEAFMWFLEYPGSGAGIALSILPVFVIVYLCTRSVREAFGFGDGAGAG